MRRSLPALVVAGLALFAPAAAHAQTPFTFQPGPSSPYGTSLATDAHGTAWLATYQSGVPGKVRVSVRRADGSVRLVRTYTAPAGSAVLAPKVAARGGLATVAWSQYRGSGRVRAMAARCTPSACGRAQEVGRAQRVKTEATPVVDEHGRSFVFWRGTSSKGPRLQWALTTDGRFGKVHTLGRFGSDLAAVADPRGGEVLAWIDPDGRLAVARRRSGEVATPQHLSAARASDPQLAAAGPEVVAAWRDGFGDGEGQPGAGPVHAAVRAAGTYDFGPAQTVFAGNGRDLTLATDGQGRAALAFADAGAKPDAAFLATSVVSVRQPTGTFGSPVALGAGPLYSAPAVTIAGGRAFGAWASQTDLQQPARIKVAEVQGTAIGPALDLGSGSAPLAAATTTGPLFMWAGPSSYLGFAL